MWIGLGSYDGVIEREIWLAGEDLDDSALNQQIPELDETPVVLIIPGLTSDSKDPVSKLLACKPNFAYFGDHESFPLRMSNGNLTLYHEALLT